MAYMCAENGNLMAIAQQLVQQQQQQQQQIFPNPSGYFNGGSMSMSMGGVNMNMNMSPWLSAPTAWQHDGLMSFPPGICTDVVGDLCSTTTNSYLSEPNSVLDLSRASMLFSPMEQFQDFTQHLHDGIGAKQMPLLGGVEPPAPAFKDNALYHHEALIKKERPPIKEPGVGDGSSAALRSSVFRSPELQTFGFESPVSNRNDFVSPDVCTEWMDCLMSDLSPEAIAGNGNAAIASCFDSSNPCESTESSELPNGGSGYRRHSSEDAAAWQSEFGILGEAFKRSSPTSWTPDTTTEQLLCSSPSADLLSAASSELLSTNSLKGKAALQEQYSGAAGGGHEFQTLHHRVPNVHQSVCPPMQQLIREPSTPPQKRQQGQQQQDPLKGKREEDSPKPEIDALDRHMQGQRSDLLHSLLDCAKIVDTEPERAGKSVAYLQGIASHHGDPTQRIVSHFAAALAKRLAKGIEQKPQFQSSDECSKSFEDLTLAYKALNDACPYSKFAQLTGNQAILEAMDKAEKIHIVDFGIVQGVQWAALLHAFATRPGGKPRKIKITGIPAPTLGQNPTSSLLATGKRLTEFAKLLDLEFEFCAVSKHMSEVELSTLKIEQDECIAVNFMLQLYNLLGDSPEPLVKILKLAHALSPKVVTLGEYEAHLNACHFPVRFRNALEYFSAFFDSMEPNMARDSAERLNVEKLFFAEKIMGIVAFEGAERKIRLEGRDQWRILMESAGFKFTNLSHYARSQARILLYNYCEAYSPDEKVQELLMELNISKKHEEELLSKLQNTSNELENCLKRETNYIARDEEPSLKILTLEREIQALTNEKNNLIQEVEESNIVKTELESCKITLDGYKIERIGLEASLQRVGQEKTKLEEDLSSLKETLRNSDADVDKLTRCKDELQRTVASLQFTLEDKLTELSAHYEQMNAVMELRSRPSELEWRLLEQESKTQDMEQLIVLQKDIQQKAEAETSQLRAEKDNLEQHLSGLQEIIQSANADIALIKRECEDKVQELITQLDLSNKRQEALLSRLQAAWDDNENLMNNETNYIQRNQELCSKISELEGDIQAVIVEKNYLVQKVEESNVIKSELESCKRNLDGYKIERTVLEASLQMLSQEKDNLEDELTSLKETQKISDADVDRLKCCKDTLEKMVASLQFTLEEKVAELTSHYEQKNELMELRSHQSELERLVEQESKTEDMKHLLVLQKELQQKAEEESSQLCAEKNNLDEYSSGLRESLERANAEVAFVKKESEQKVQEFMTQLDQSNREQEALLSRLQTASSDNEKLMNNETNYIQRKQELCSKISELETEIQIVLKDKNSLIERMKECDSMKAEFERCKMVLESAKEENAQLNVSLHRVNQEKCKLEDELCSLKAVLESSDRELGDLKCSRGELEMTVTFLKSKLDDQHAQISFCNDQRDELIQLRRQHSELKNKFLEEELKTEDLSKHLFHSKELLQHADAEVSELRARKDDLEACLSVTQESLQRANADTAFMTEQFEAKDQELAMSTKQREDLLTRLQTALSGLEIQTKDEAKYLRLNEELSVKLSKLEAEVETLSNVENDILHKAEEYDGIKAEIQNIKKRLDICNAEKAELEVSLDGAIQERQNVDEELSSVKEMLRNSDSELDELKRCKNELEIRVAFLQSKMDEQNNEFMQLLRQHDKLKHCLTEQEVKTEELKMNLTQLKDLQEKAEADAYQLRVQKKELEHQSTMKQESLRIALIREQYESKEQDFAKQLNILNQHREELLLKLQDTLTELEMRTKSETHYMKKTEEFSARNLLLETEVQSLLDENNGLVQKVKEYESVKAELENHKTSLECWKAEKEELEYLLRRANVQKGQLDNELCSLKEILKYSDVELDELKCCKDELEMTVASLQSRLNGQTAELLQLQEQHSELKKRLLEQEWEIENLMNVKTDLEKQLQEKADADALVEIERKLKDQDENSEVSASGSHNSKSGHLLDISSHTEKELADLKEKVKLLEGELKSKTIALEASQKEFAGNENKSFNPIENVEMIDEYHKEESLNSSMDRLHKELEKMKNENLAPFQQENELLSELDAQDPLQKEVQQLQMANEQLESMFPSFIEPSKAGNAIERVLALETELADSLKANSTKKRQFQSSFVKQQADQAAMLQSFRDINELINDMLELKRKNSVLDDELKEMQRRYSQISLQFAEVEGERQQLVMTIKSMRAGKKS